jgi:hypothetical protein
MNTELLTELIKDSDVTEPETIRQLWPDLSEEEIDKAFALKIISHTKFFWEHFFIFEKLVLAVNGFSPDFTRLEGCTPEQIWYAVFLANKIRPGLEYADEVQLYAKYMCNEQGCYIYPPQLGLDNPYLAKAMEIAKFGPFPIGEGTTEEIQAGKFLMIQEYLNEKEKQ